MYDTSAKLKYLFLIIDPLILL